MIKERNLTIEQQALKHLGVYYSPEGNEDCPWHGGLRTYADPLMAAKEVRHRGECCHRPGTADSRDGSSPKVRVDFFKASGKWYTDEIIEFSEEEYKMVQPEAFRSALDRHLKGRMKGMTAVCLTPFNRYSHPIMMEV